jgi:hypothetical protein
MPVIDKLRTWKQVCHCVLENGNQIGYVLQDKAYLDSWEESQAVVGVQGWNLLEVLEKQRVVPVLERAFAAISGKAVRVKLANGQPRILETKAARTAEESLSAKMTSNKPELEALHAKYGDIMGIVDNHPVFVRASKPLTQGGWGIFNKELTIACKDYGADVVLKGLRDVASRPDVERPRPYFLKNLRAGVYGHRLAVGASPIGPAPK